MSKILSLFVVAVFAIVAVFSISAASATNYNFQLTEAIRGLKFAKAAYCDASSIRSWTCPACPLHPNFKVKNVYNNASLDSQAFSGYDAEKNDIVVVFRGSQNLINWISDFTFSFVDYPYCSGCQVHKGFYEEWQSYEVPIIQDMTALVAEHPTATVSAFGHSLGAAVAVHAVATFNRIKLANTINEYSYGTPRTGNLAWAEWVYLVAKSSYGTTQRVVNAKDPVPHLPPMFFSYIHTPHESWFPQGGTSPLDDCNDSNGHEDPDCSDSVLAIDPEDHTHYLGMRTECNMELSSGKKLTLDPAVKDRLNKMIRKDRILAAKKK